MYQNPNLLAVDWSLGINVTICGLVIVFAMLILLVVILYISGAIFGAVAKRANDGKKAEVKPAPVKKAAAPVVSVPTAVANDDEIIAVIAAAVASMYEGSGVKPVIRAVKRASGNARPAWTSAGIYENTRAF